MNSYYDYLYTPWGQMFYKLLWTQIEASIPKTNQLTILDYGSGFGKTADHFASKHKVTAYEPNEGMLDKAFTQNTYTQLTGDYDTFLNQIAGQSFDLILVHNVLEYVPEKMRVLTDLQKHLRDNGQLSIVKHNQLGEVFAQAIFFDNPAKALELTSSSKGSSANLGDFQFYSNDWLLENCPVLHLEKCFGIRTFYGLSQNNEIKSEENWQEKMFELESSLSEDERISQVAFFNHLVLGK